MNTRTTVERGDAWLLLLTDGTIELSETRVDVFSVVSGCLAPCFVFLGGERLWVQTGNHDNTLYCIYITHDKRSPQIAY